MCEQNLILNPLPLAPNRHPLLCFTDFDKKKCPRIQTAPLSNRPHYRHELLSNLEKAASPPTKTEHVHFETCQIIEQIHAYKHVGFELTPPSTRNPCVFSSLE